MLPLASTDELEGGFRYDNVEYTKDGAKVEFDEVLAAMERNGDAETVYEADAENGGEEKKNDKSKEESATLSAIPAAVTVASVDGPLPIGDIIAAGIMSVAVTKDLLKETQRTYITYKLVGPDGKIYVGRASGFGTPLNLQQKSGQKVKRHF